MIRRIIEINEEKCNGCGACAAACHESAIGMANGKAKLLRDDYCDGLGDCLPQCPTGAIKFVEREAAEYDEAAVLANKKKKGAEVMHGCPGSRAMRLKPPEYGAAEKQNGVRLFEKMRHHGTDAESSREAVRTGETSASGKMDTIAFDRTSEECASEPARSQLAQWPCQIKLVPVRAPYFEGADLLITADCTAYAYANFHQEFMRGRITLIGCPKLDSVGYSEKLTEIIRENDMRSVTVLRMEVPCCGGLEQAAKKALQRSGKRLPWQVVTVAVDGTLR